MDKLSNSERIIAFLSGLVTVVTFLLSIPKITITIPALELFSTTSLQLQESQKALKFVVFVICDGLSALFFSYIFSFLVRKFKTTPLILFAYLSLFILSTYLSVLFINTIFFPLQIVSDDSIGLYCGLIISSGIISYVFFIQSIIDYPYIETVAWGAFFMFLVLYITIGKLNL
jgi:hypothetical protein